jgi:hypothetical protein
MMAEKRLGVVYRRFQRKQTCDLRLLSAEIHCMLAANAGKGWPRVYVAVHGSRVLISWAGSAEAGSEIVEHVKALGCKIVAPVRPTSEGRYGVRVVRA